MEHCKENKYGKWTSGDIHCLIDLYKRKMKNEYKYKIWTSITKEFNGLRARNFTVAQCSRKFRLLKSTYKEVKEHNGRTGNGRRHWEYFEALTPLFSHLPEIQPPATCSSIESVVVLDGEQEAGEKDYDFFDFIEEVPNSESAAVNHSTTSKKKTKKASDTQTDKMLAEIIVQTKKHNELFEEYLNILKSRNA